MTTQKQAQLRSVLQALAHISYTALIEVRQVQGANKSKIEELEKYKEILEESIFKIFEE